MTIEYIITTLAESGIELSPIDQERLRYAFKFEPQETWDQLIDEAIEDPEIFIDGIKQIQLPDIIELPNHRKN